MTRDLWSKLWPVTAVLIFGAAFRIVMLGLDVRFHPDEALYGAYARRMISHADLLLADVPLDKPPLGLAISAAGMGLWGESEFGARFPTVLISILDLAVWYGVCERLWSRRTALGTLLLLACSPFDLAFAATLFHDPLLGLWMGLITLSAARGKLGWAGFFSACALFTKQSAVQFVPIYLLLGLSGYSPLWGPGWAKHIRRYLIPLVIGVILLALWSVARAAPVDFWTLGVTNPGALRLIRADEVMPRLHLWVEYGRWAVNFAPLMIFVIVPLGAAVITPRRHYREGIALLGLIGTLGLYWLVAYPVYDRYLYPLIPLMCLLIVRGLEIVCGGWRRIIRPQVETKGVWISLSLCVVLGAPTVLQTLRGQAPIGGDLGKHQGITSLAEAIGMLPPDTFIWEHDLGWELLWYLGPTPMVKVIFQPTPEAMARAVCAQTVPTYFAAFRNKADRWIVTSREMGVEVSTVLGGQLGLYKLRCKP